MGLIIFLSFLGSILWAFLRLPGEIADLCIFRKFVLIATGSLLWKGQLTLEIGPRRESVI